MDLVAVQPYIKIHREVSAIEQKDIVYDRNIYLYVDRIVTKYHEFPLVDVFDMSYRDFGSEVGLLYLHTRMGVYSYTVQSSPEHFIMAYHGLGKK
ncbi:hypothetical protein HNQ94_001612 [Salirhabdus euzebyi]|uniref:Uncharacterized protein n=1 Tax=Salirhabdus euzebyi TaxID=394506 RepID=A0A841Q439_9BACI|nr:hypothetical protein [Salirhabdus euzebyi]MBB6453164.1 hypothetical protein [Salirhabdus euzebyi]